MGSPSTALRLDEDRCYDALVSRDRRFDGQFIAAITSTGIYCRPSCPAPVRPKRANVRVYATAAAAQHAGFRSCKRCRPDAAPGSPEWDQRGDLVGRAMRLIEAGEIDRVGVAGLARRLSVSERHLNRILNEVVGAGPVALARAQRANLARILLETTEMSVTDTAFASGFSSVRQFNDTVRTVYDRTPTELRLARRSVKTNSGDSGVNLRMWLPARQPIDHEWMFGFLAGHATPGLAFGDNTTFTRVMSLAAGVARVTAAVDTRDSAGIWATFELDHIRDLAEAIARVRRMFDLDSDPQHIDETLGSDPIIGPLRRLRPGVRVPGAVDGFEAAIGAIVGQQISVAGANTLMGRIVTAANSGSDTPMTFPTPQQLAELNLDGLGLTTRRRSTIASLADAVANERIVVDSVADRADTRRALLALPGIGPWTADVIAMRALGDPDVLLDSDLVIGRRLAEIGSGSSGQWAPWRSYVTCTLWATRNTTKEVTS